MSKDDDKIILPDKPEAQAIPDVSNATLEEIARAALITVEQTVAQVTGAHLNRMDANQALQLSVIRSQAVQSLALARLCRYAGIEGLCGEEGHDNGAA